MWVIHRGPVNSPHKWPVTLKKFPFYDVIMTSVKYERDTELVTAFLVGMKSGRTMEWRKWAQ